MFLTRLEDAVEARPLVLAHHMDLYAWEAFIKFPREFVLDKICMLLADPR
jgi:hypothetical protein